MIRKIISIVLISSLLVSLFSVSVFADTYASKYYFNYNDDLGCYICDDYSDFKYVAAVYSSYGPKVFILYSDGPFWITYNTSANKPFSVGGSGSLIYYLDCGYINDDAENNAYSFLFDKTADAKTKNYKYSFAPANMIGSLKSQNDIHFLWINHNYTVQNVVDGTAASKPMQWPGAVNLSGQANAFAYYLRTIYNGLKNIKIELFGFTLTGYTVIAGPFVISVGIMLLSASIGVGSTAVSKGVNQSKNYYKRKNKNESGD